MNRNFNSDSTDNRNLLYTVGLANKSNQTDGFVKEGKFWHAWIWACNTR